ncbi:uncharacterized protein LOC131204638 [Ahaetulla prasina]|uniref:uncharacterized protein LOC131204638 n=1 Tax=Ahaetulla prasina TaxID=499056 RepID=UPI002649041E|nr:uncharacterized protein LOC131204638 [Ahaetulla prasina]
MEPFRSQMGPQTALFLAGCILSGLLQLVAAQGNLTVASVPKHPIQGQSIILNPMNIREGSVQCEWTQPSGNKIIFASGTKLNTANASQVVVVHQNCSLTIKNLRSSDRGMYTVRVTVPPAKQQGTEPEVYVGFISLIFCDEIHITINTTSPLVGQHVTLSPRGIPDTFNFCQWKQKTQSGVEKVFQNFGEVSPNKQQNQQQTIKRGCTLHLNQITVADSGNYSVYVNVSSNQNSGKGTGTRQQNTCYQSQMQLRVRTSGSAAVKYSTGIIAGALLGSLTWTSSLSLVPLLFGVLSQSFPKC